MNLNQVTLPSLDVERAAAFYKLLGLNLIVDALPRYVRFEVPDGDATLSIHKVERLNNDNGIVIYFENERLDTLVDQLKAKDVIFTNEPENKPYLWREASLKDPDGNMIILYHAGKNRKNPPWRIKNQ